MLAVSLIVMPFADGLPSFFIIFIIFGLGEGAVATCINAFLPQSWHGSRWLSPAQQWVHFWYGVGGFLAPYLVEQMDFDSFFWLLGVLNMAPLVGFIFLGSPHDVPYHENKEDQEKPTEISRLSPQEMCSSINHKKLGKRIIFIGCLGLMFVFIGIQVTFSEWIFIYAEEHFNVDKSTATHVTASFWAAMVVFRLVGVGVSFFLKPITILLINFVIATMGLSLFLLFTNQLALWLGTIMTGASMATMFGAIFTLPPTAGSDIFTSTEAGWLVATSAGGVVVANAAIGFILEQTSYYFVAVLWQTLAVCGLLLWLCIALGIYTLLMKRMANIFFF